MSAATVTTSSPRACLAGLLQAIIVIACDAYFGFFKVRSRGRWVRTWLGILHVSAKDPRGLIGVELKAGDSRSLAYQLCFGLLLFFSHTASCLSTNLPRHDFYDICILSIVILHFLLQNQHTQRASFHDSHLRNKHGTKKTHPSGGFSKGVQRRFSLTGEHWSQEREHSDFF